jgi:hypothetical protein
LLNKKEQGKKKKLIAIPNVLLVCQFQQLEQSRLRDGVPPPSLSGQRPAGHLAAVQAWRRLRRPLALLGRCCGYRRLLRPSVRGGFALVVLRDGGGLLRRSKVLHVQVPGLARELGVALV